MLIYPFKNDDLPIEDDYLAMLWLTYDKKDMIYLLV
jgi:hypothetical protein